MADPLKQAQAQIKALKEEVSELGRQHELRGRELAAARKQAAKVDDLEAELAKTQEKAEACNKALAEAEREVEDLQAKVAKNDGILEDVAALKRLVG